MIFVLMITLLAASPSRAQTGGGCGQISDCPDAFMPAAVVPNALDRQKVQAALAAAASAASTENGARSELQKRYLEIRGELKKSYRLLPDSVAERLVTDEKVRTAAMSDQLFLKKEERLRTAIADNYSSHNEAIRQAAIVYQLTPPIPDFTGDPRAPGVNMKSKPWLPRYSRHEIFDGAAKDWRKRTDGELANEARQDGMVAAALTMENGEMRVFDQAFTTPEGLAIVLYHETSHWVDVSGKSGGFQRSDPPEVSFRTEQHAYERAARFTAQVGLNAQWQLSQAGQFRLQADQASAEKLSWDQVAVRHPRWIGRDRKGMLAMTPATPEISVDDESWLRRKMAEAQRLVAEDRRRREESDSRPPVVAPIEIHPVDPGQMPEGYSPAVPVHPGEGLLPARPVTSGAGTPAIRTIRQIAKDACAAPPRPFDEWLSWIAWADVRKVTDAQAQADGLSACESRVFWRLVNFGKSWQPGQTLSSDEVRAAAVEPYSAPAFGGGQVPPSQSHDPVWGRVGPIIGR